MSDPELAVVRAPEAVTVTALRVRNLKGQKGDSVNVMIKAEFGERVLGESTKVECTPEADTEINFASTFNVTFEDPYSLDEIAYKPVLLTFIEILPKERRQKEEKTVILGQVAVDLSPLLNGEKKHTLTLAVNPLPGSPMESLPPEAPQPEVDVSLFVAEELLSEGLLNDTNLMSVTVESLFSPPESWSLNSQHFYTAALPVPLTGERENTVVFAGGQLKPGVDKEIPNKQKKWASPGSAQGNAVYIPNQMISGEAIEDEDGDFKSKDEREHRIVSEQDKNRVTWNIERRCHLEAAACKSLQDKVAKTRFWPVEVMRAGIPGGGKGKKDEDGHISFHGVAYVNMAPLLYPGVKRIRGAYRVWAYNDSDVQEKTLRKGSVADDAMRIATGILSRSSSSPFPKKGKDDKKDKEPKKGPSGAIKTGDGSSDTGQQEINIEGQQYVDAKSYVMIEICLRRPLVPKRPPEELAKEVAEYIPPRPLFPKRTDGAQKAVEEFHGQVGKVAGLILDEFREQFGEVLAAAKQPQTHEEMEGRRQKLIYHLNASGKYFAFKEQLKHAVVKIVREKYLKTSNFKDQSELQAFLSELYVYLVDQMHVGLNKVLAVEDQSPIPEPLTDSAQLKHFAREAEVNRNFELASRYYQERIAREKNDPDHWLDYGTFSLYINDLTKAEECFKECVAIDQRHLHGLLLYGVVCTMQDKHEAAETFFEAATCVDPTSILAWTMLGLFYDGIGNEIGAEMALLEANKLNVQAAKALREEEKEKERIEREKERQREEREKEREREKEALEEKEKPETEEEPTAKDSLMPGDSGVSIKQTPPTPASSITGSDTASKSKINKEKRHSAGGRRSSPVSTRVKSSEHATASRPGSTMQVKSPAPASPEEQEDLPPPREPTPIPAMTIFMQCVEFLLEVKAMPFTERALAHQLLDPLGGPSAEYHICLARLKLQKGDMMAAEDSLKEALQFDHQNPDAWALMGHVKYLVGDTDTAKDCYERTLAFLSTASEMHSIYLRLASIYLQEGKFQDAKNTFLYACKRSPSCVAWLGVGIACYRLGELSEAEDALAEANILNNSDAEVWAYLSLVCLRTGRQVEAEQSYKYALKLNLQDEQLLNELHTVQQEVGFGNPQL